MLPKLGTVRRNVDPVVYCKFIDSVTSHQWLVLEGEKQGDTYRFYGLIVGQEVTLGEFTLKLLESKETVRLALFFKPAPLSYVKLPQLVDNPEYHII
jgi:hypothetical protein